MLWIILGLIATFYFVYKSVEPDNFIEWFLYLVMAGAAALLSILVSSIWAMLLGYAFEQEKYVVETYQISALADNSKIEGRFFLGSGSINENQKYFFMKKEDGGLIMDYIPATGSIVYEGYNEPFIEKLESRFVNDWWSLIALPGFNKGHYKVYVPENSITTDFIINLQ